MEIQIREQTTFQSLLKAADREAKDPSQKGQVMIVFQCTVNDAFFNLLLNKRYDTYRNMLFRDCDESLKRHFPNKKNKSKIHTEFQLVWDENIIIPRDSVLVIYSWYIPCTIEKCAQKLVEFAKKKKIKIIVGYNEVFCTTRKDESLKILNEGNIEVFCVDDLD